MYTLKIKFEYYFLILGEHLLINLVLAIHCMLIRCGCPNSVIEIPSASKSFKRHFVLMGCNVLWA